MEASYRSSPFFADLDMNDPPRPPPVVPPRPKAPPRIRNPPRRTNATWNLLAFTSDAHEPSAKKESD